MIEGIVLAVLERVLGAYIASVLAKGSSQRRRQEILGVVRQYLERLVAVSDEVAALNIAMRELDLLVRQHPMLHWADDEELVVDASPASKTSEPIVSAREAIAILQQEVERRRAETDALPQEAPAVGGAPELVRRSDLAERESRPPAATEERAIASLAADDSDIGSWTAEVNRLHSEVRRERRRRSS